MSHVPQWFVFPSLIRDAAIRATVANENIIESFVRAVVRVDSGSDVWGQYMDRPDSKQVGLYGTAAGVGTLSQQHEHESLRSGAISYLLGRYEGRIRSATDHYQFELIPKVAAFLSAFYPIDLAGDQRIAGACTDLIEILNNAQKQDAGWGYYYSSPTLKDDDAHIAPTALVLLAARQIRVDNMLASRLHAVRWLSTQTQTHYRSMFPGELALALLALRQWLPHEDVYVPYRELKPAHRWLLKQIALSPTAWEEYPVSYEAITSDGGKSTSNDEYFVIHSVLLILEYLLRYSPVTLMRTDVFRRCQTVLENIEQNRFYISPFNRRASTRTNQRAHNFCLTLNEMLTDSTRYYVVYGLLAMFKAVFTKRSLIFASIIFLTFLSIRGIEPRQLIVSLMVSIIAGLAANAIANRT